MIRAQRLLILSLLMVLVGCTRPGAEMTTITVAIPPNVQARDVGSLAVVDPISIIIINVSGAGMDDIFYQWNGCPDGCVAGPQPAPSSVQIDVPSGFGRLVQVLEVAEASSGIKTFYYGDGLADLTAASASTTVTVAQTGTASGNELHFSGRYVSQYTAGNYIGPTGQYRTLFSPQNGRKAMTVYVGEIFNGWLNGFIVDGALFSYVFEDGTTLFSNLDYTNSPSAGGALSPQNWRMVYSVKTTSLTDSVHFYNHYSSGGTDRTMVAGQSSRVIGYFNDTGLGGGPGTKVCKGTGITLPDFYANYSNPNFLTPLTFPADFNITGSTTGCSGTQYKDYLNLSPGTSAGDPILDFDSPIGIRGPFQVLNPTQGGDSAYITTAYNATTQQLNVSWQWIDGINLGANSLDGAKVYFGSGFTKSQIKSSNGAFRCGDLPSLGFTSVDAPYTSTTGTATLTGITPTQFGQGSVVVCPYKTVSGSPRIFNHGIANLCTSCSSQPYFDFALGKPYGPLLGGTNWQLYHLNWDSMKFYPVLINPLDNTRQFFTFGGSPGNSNITTPTFNGATLTPQSGEVNLYYTFATATPATPDTTTMQLLATLTGVQASNPSYASPMVTAIGNTTCASATLEIAEGSTLSAATAMASTTVATTETTHPIWLRTRCGTGPYTYYPAVPTIFIDDATQQEVATNNAEGGWTNATTALGRNCFLPNDAIFSHSTPGKIILAHRDQFATSCRLNFTSVTLAQAWPTTGVLVSTAQPYVAHHATTTSSYGVTFSPSSAKPFVVADFLSLESGTQTLLGYLDLNLTGRSTDANATTVDATSATWGGLGSSTTSSQSISPTSSGTISVTQGGFTGSIAVRVAAAGGARTFGAPLMPLRPSDSAFVVPNCNSGGTGCVLQAITQGTFNSSAALASMPSGLATATYFSVIPDGNNNTFALASDGTLTNSYYSFQNLSGGSSGTSWLAMPTTFSNPTAGQAFLSYLGFFGAGSNSLYGVLQTSSGVWVTQVQINSTYYSSPLTTPQGSAPTLSSQAGWIISSNSATTIPAISRCSGSTSWAVEYRTPGAKRKIAWVSGQNVTSDEFGSGAAVDDLIGTNLGTAANLALGCADTAGTTPRVIAYAKGGTSGNQYLEVVRKAVSTYGAAQEFNMGTNEAVTAVAMASPTYGLLTTYATIGCATGSSCTRLYRFLWNGGSFTLGGAITEIPNMQFSSIVFEPDTVASHGGAAIPNFWLLGPNSAAIKFRYVSKPQ